MVLLVCGALLGFVPALRSTHLPPSAVLLHLEDRLDLEELRLTDEEAAS